MNKIFAFICGYMLFPILVTAQTPPELKSFLPEMAGWKISDEVEVFNPDNLFKRINGAAPLFIENNFREMTSMQYTQGKDYITIQAYRHETPRDAFGMYSSERSSELTFYPIGGEAQGDEYGLYFFAGCIYVKMQNNNPDKAGTEVMRSIAKGFAEKIDPQADYPLILRKFPKEGKLPYTEAYITSNYIGHEFLKSVYTADYHLKGEKVQLFVVDGKDQSGAQDMLSRYFDFTKQDKNVSEGNILIQDKFNGNIPCIWSGRYIIGIFNEKGDEISGADTLLDEMKENLGK